MKRITNVIPVFFVSFSFSMQCDLKKTRAGNGEASSVPAVGLSTAKSVPMPLGYFTDKINPHLINVIMRIDDEEKRRSRPETQKTAMRTFGISKVYDPVTEEGEAFSIEDAGISMREMCLQTKGIILDYVDSKVFLMFRLHQNFLHMAASIGDFVKIQLGIEKGVDINEVDDNLETPLIIAAISNHLAVVRLLLVQKKVEVNRQDKWGNTALHYGLRMGHDAIVRELLSHDDIDVTIRNYANRIAGELAREVTSVQEQGLTVEPVTHGIFEARLASWDGLTRSQRREGRARAFIDWEKYISRIIADHK